MDNQWFYVFFSKAKPKSRRLIFINYRLPKTPGTPGEHLNSVTLEVNRILQGPAKASGLAHVNSDFHHTLPPVQVFDVRHEFPALIHAPYDC